MHSKIDAAMYESFHAIFKADCIATTAQNFNVYNFSTFPFDMIHIFPSHMTLICNSIRCIE